MSRLVWLLFLFCLILPGQEVSQSGLKLEAARPMIDQAERAPQAMAATVHELATQAAIDIMKKGGNAVDATVAVGFVLAVVHPEAGNLGGSGYMMVRMADGQTVVFDYGVNYPKGAAPGMFQGSPDRNVGYKAIGVPGTPAGMGMAHARFGKLKWRDVLEPARKLAKDGFPASQRLEIILKLQVPVMKRYPETAKVFLHGSDRPLQQGEPVIQKDLAGTISRMQKKGWQEFYTGETAQRIAADIAAAGGVLSAEDLKSYQARENAPLRISYRGYPILLNPPSSAGGTAVAVMLNTLEQFDLKLGMEGSSFARHLQIEAMRIGFGARARVAGGQPVEQVVGKDYAQQAAKTISLERATPLNQPLPSGFESFDTTHYTVADPYGNIVANTYTLNGFFGSQVIPKGTGVLMNNYLNANMTSMKPGERIYANMSPTIILRKDETPWAAFGTPGAMTIASTLAQIVVNLIDFRMSLRDAIEFPRIHYAGGNSGVEAEPAALIFDVAEKLRTMGHKLNPALRSQGDVNAIVIEEGTGWKQGWADGRRGGVVRGY